MNDIRNIKDDSLKAMQSMAVGLCKTCRHCKPITNARGSVFYWCRLSETDPAYPKYPRLPVLKCGGYNPG